MPGNKKAYNPSRNHKEDVDVTVTKKGLDDAIDLIYEEDTSKEKLFGGPKSLRECHSASMKAHNLRGAADIFTSENATAEMLEELRISLLENNVSASAKILESLIQTTSNYVLPAIWKSAIVLFLNQQSSEQGILDEFLELCTGQRDAEDKRRLIEMLVYLPDLIESTSKNEPTHNRSKIDEATSVLSEDEDLIFFES